MDCAFLHRLAGIGIDQDLLRAVEGDLGEPFSFAKGEHLFREGEVADHLYFVEEGWLSTQDFLADGQAFFRSLFMPGDVAGFVELAWGPAAVDLVALGDGRARRLSRAGLDALMHRHPTFASPLLTMGIVHQTATADRHAHALRSDGRGRLLYLLLELHARQSIDAPAEWIEVPLTQVQLANAIGMTNVHVNALLRGLEEEGLLSRARGRMRIHDIARARGSVSYRDRWGNVDLGWSRAFRSIERIVAMGGGSGG